MESLRGSRVLVLGVGMTGQSAAAFCAARGAHVVLADERADAVAPAVPPDVELALGRPFPDPAAFDLVVPSPGVPLARWRRARCAWGDIELAFQALAVPVVAVSGTNGKSTTTRLVEAMLRAAGLRALAAGNVGHPALDLVGRPLDVAVLEVSSFQLESVERFRPRAAVMLAVTPDHLDRHGSLEGYRAMKARLFAAQEPDDVAVLDASDAWLESLAPTLRARVWRFRERGPVDEGAFLDGEAVCLRREGRLQRLAVGPLPPGLASFPGNVLAALLAACAVGAEPAKALGALTTFQPLPHRAQLVAEAGGVRWIDDSKATNPGAALAALAGQSGPVIWIAGGKDKGLAFEVLRPAVAARVRCGLLIGETAAALAAQLAGSATLEQVGSLEAAVARARELARPGDVVLLSPACASFDQFRDYAHRGERFAELVRAALAEARP